MAPGENTLFLYPPPFVTVQSCIDAGESWFWTEWVAPLPAPEQCLVIGDFGLGPDAPILLDCSDAQASPRVVRLHCGDHDQRRWALMGGDIESFVVGLGL